MTSRTHKNSQSPAGPQEDPLRLLLVTADDASRFVVEAFLRTRGYEVRSADQRTDAVSRLAEKFRPSFILVDGSLVEPGAVAICALLRITLHEPLIVFGVLDVAQSALALDAGADVCLVGPIHTGQLDAQIQAMHRRIRTSTVMPMPEYGQLGDVMHFGDLVVDSRSRKAYHHGTLMDFRPCEFDILEYLARNVARGVTRDEIYRELYRKDFDGTDRRLDVRIAALRKGLGDTHGDCQYIHTIRGKGYRFSPPSISTLTT